MSTDEVPVACGSSSRSYSSDIEAIVTSDDGEGSPESGGDGSDGDESVGAGSEESDVEMTDP